MLNSREGFTIDFVAAGVKKWLLNPVVSVPVALSVSWEPILSRIWSRLDQHASTSLFSGAQYVSQIAAFIGVLIYLNDYLNKQSANNWTSPSKWDWNEEVVLITGGSGGIGAAIAQQLIARNARTQIVILDLVPLSWVPPPSSRIQYYQCDLSDSSVIREMSEQVRSQCGHPTVLVNNAGIARRGTIMDGTYGDMEETIRVNLLAPMLLIKEFLPEMVRRDHGHIVNVSSMSSIVPLARLADYSATKAGLTAMHEALQLELSNVHRAPRVRLTLGLLSFIRTPLISGGTGHSNFIAPMLHVDSVAENLAATLYSGYGKTIFMPGITSYIAAMRAGPEWCFRALRNTTTRMRVKLARQQTVDENTNSAVQRG